MIKYTGHSITFKDIDHNLNLTDEDIQTIEERCEKLRLIR